MHRYMGWETRRFNVVGAAKMPSSLACAASHARSSGVAAVSTAF
jgi:hypothetical protein